MSENRLPDYLAHMHQAATDACAFVAGLGKTDFLEDKRTQQAVIMSLIIIGDAATTVMDGDPDLTLAHAQVPWRDPVRIPAESRFFLQFPRVLTKPPA